MDEKDLRREKDEHHASVMLKMRQFMREDCGHDHSAGVHTAGEWGIGVNYWSCVCSLSCVATEATGLGFVLLYQPLCFVCQQS